jgi:hypothetical protein
VKLATLPGDVYAFADDEKLVYYGYWQYVTRSGAVGAIRKDGGGSTTIATLDLEPRSLGFDELDLFYTAGIRLMTVPKAGGEPRVIAPQFSAKAIALDAGHVYGVPGDYGPYDRIAKISKKGGGVNEIFDQKRPTVKDGVSGLSSIAVDASGLYVADSGGNRILRFAPQGGSPKVLARGKGAFALALDDASVFYTLAAEGDLMKVAKAGGAAARVASGLVRSARIAVDARAVVTTFAGETDDSPATVASVPAGGGDRVPIASVPRSESVDAVELDDRCVYWVQRTGPGTSVVHARAR